MKRNETMLKTGCSRIFWAVIAIVLFAVPCTFALDLEISSNYPGPVYLNSGDTLSLMDGGYITGGLYANSGSTVTITGGGVEFYIIVSTGASVTVIGTDFAVTNGIIDPSGSYFIINPVDSLASLTGIYVSGSDILLNFYSDPGVAIYLGTADNESPVANAGPDLTIYYSDIASKVIQGTADDPDESDILHYRWLKGTVEFTLWASVGENGEAPLDLGTIDPQYLGVGTHTLILEVTDGKETVSDEMVLEILPTHVEIDIKPGCYPNPINQGSNGIIPVAILTTDTFNAADVDPGTVTLNEATVAVRGKSLKLMARLEDVDGDGDDDLMLQVETESWADLGEDGEVTLSGETYDGQAIEGKDYVVIVPPLPE